MLDLLLHEHDGKKFNPDTWKKPKLDAVVELAAALCVLREWKQPFVLQAGEEWTALLGDGLSLVVLDGEGDEHSWEGLVRAYWKAFENHYNRPQMRERPVLIVTLRSRGLPPRAVHRFQLAITEPSNRNRLGSSPSIDEPRRPTFWVCKGDLLDQAKLQESIRDYVAAEMGCIYE